MRVDLPSGTVTFVFTDIEGSTRLLDQLGPVAYADALAGHRRVVREVCTAFGGAEVDTQGDAFFLAFGRAADGLDAARQITDRLGGGPIRLRIGVHTGSPLLAESLPVTTRDRVRASLEGLATWHQVAYGSRRSRTRDQRGQRRPIHRAFASACRA
jgi:class 3 adenylate cyclase